MFKVGDMVQRTEKRYSAKRRGPFKVTEVNGVWFNHDGGVAEDYQKGGGCSVGFWELAPKPFKVGDKVIRKPTDRTHLWITETSPMQPDAVHEVEKLVKSGVMLQGLRFPYNSWAFELAPATTARSTDPDTSKKAAIKAKRTPLRERIDQYLCIGMSATGTEIAAALNAKLNSVTPRFAELSRAGIIKDSGKRRDGQIVWVRA